MRSLRALAVAPVIMGALSDEEIFLSWLRYCPMTSTGSSACFLRRSLSTSSLLAFSDAILNWILSEACTYSGAFSGGRGTRTSQQTASAMNPFCSSSFQGTS